MISSAPWSLIYERGESRHSELSTGGRTPLYPFLEQRPVRTGGCVKGWLNFSDIAGEPEGAEYAVDGFTASWRF